jgi:hypothetical protein
MAPGQNVDDLMSRFLRKQKEGGGGQKMEEMAHSIVEEVTGILISD